MTRDTAHAILDAARAGALMDGQPVPWPRICLALRETGDIGKRTGRRTGRPRKHPEQRLQRAWCPLREAT